MLQEVMWSLCMRGLREKGKDAEVREVKFYLSRGGELSSGRARVLCWSPEARARPGAWSE